MVVVDMTVISDTRDLVLTHYHFGGKGSNARLDLKVSK